MKINYTGYLVTFLSSKGLRTYACTDEKCMFALIERKTGRAKESISLDRHGLPALKNIKIAYPLHIYSLVE